ncbi:hypothetical protein EUTSA_v10022418mg, partial [Eutrema salsugineum]
KQRCDALIKDVNFTKKHSANASRQSLVIMLIDFRVYLVSIDLHGSQESIVKVTSQFSLKDPLSNSLKEVDIRDVFHCDGLLLCTTKDNRLVVWNPCSGETGWIIKPKSSRKRFVCYSLGKSSCNKYKILKVDQDRYGFLRQCLVVYEVYDFTSSLWRRVGETRNWCIYGFKNRGISVNGDTYWLAYRFSQDLPKEFLLRFDYSTERFESVSLPVDHLSHHPMALSVTREEQKLCLISLRECNICVFGIDVWMATKIESDGAMSWRKLLAVDGSVYRKFLVFCNGMNFLADRENKVLVFPGKNGVSGRFLHIVREDKCIQVDHNDDAKSRCSVLINYVPTLVQLQQG